MTEKRTVEWLSEIKDKLRSAGLLIAEREEALDSAIACVRQRADFRRLGRKGQKARQKKYGKRDYRKWGKMGGRPKKKKP